ncbi:hypothetical protein Ddye_002147 [Dipteronia dyeriana]|uniref:RNase H type-1 domain-containing protein n=1 Tax=Dipteronia dyeriana TaxID=168575 RepID=A0AAD9XQJ2_9ROSI|nr:hypothetical protein Ddye_002147 [Dipteronia dyeriana]
MVHALWSCRDIAMIRENFLLVKVLKLKDELHLFDFMLICFSYLSPTQLNAKSKVISGAPVTKWKPPDDGIWRINNDAVTCYNTQTVGLGIIIRDKAGLVKATASLKLQAMYEPLVAEVMAVWRGMCLAIDSGLVPFLIEFDSLKLIELIDKGTPSPTDVGSIISMILSFLRSSLTVVWFMCREVVIQFRIN